MFVPKTPASVKRQMCGAQRQAAASVTQQLGSLWQTEPPQESVVVQRSVYAGSRLDSLRVHGALQFHFGMWLTSSYGRLGIRINIRTVHITSGADLKEIRAKGDDHGPVIDCAQEILSSYNLGAYLFCGRADEKQKCLGDMYMVPN
jgi:hypothetical protein